VWPTLGPRTAEEQNLDLEAECSHPIQLWRSWGDQLYFVPSNFYNGLSFYAGHRCGNFPDLLAKFKKRRKEDWERKWVRHEWVNNGRMERNEGGK